MSFRGMLLKAGIDVEAGGGVSNIAFSGSATNGISLAGTNTTGLLMGGTYTNAISITGTISGVALNVARTSTATTGTVRDANIVHTVGANSLSKINEALRVSVESEYYTGDWVNAIVGRIDYGDAGDARGGMAAAICAEMNMPAKSYASIGGPCYSLDCEFNCPTSFVAGDRETYPIGFLKFGLWGGAKGEFDDEGYIFHTDGLTAEAGHVLSAGSQTLRVNIEGSDAYMVLSADENCYKVTSASVSRSIDLQITPTSADRQLYMDIDYGSNSKEAAYVISSSAKTSGETTAIRARGQGKATEASTAEIRGVHAQGIAFAALYTGTVNAIYAEAIAKGTSTVTTIRGAMIACDSENTPTSITNMYGAHIRVKTSVAPGTDFIGLKVETEKFGSGVKLDSLIYCKTTTWTNSENAMVAVVDMSGVVGKCDCHIRFGTGHTANGTTTEGDFWYDATNHVFKYYDNAGVKTVTAS